MLICCSSGVLASIDNTRVYIPDLTLRAMVQGEIAKNSNIITVSDMKELKNLDNKMASIEDFSGIEYAVNLKTLKIAGAQIKDISFLKSLTNLEKLEISQNQIKDLQPLAHLSKLFYLDLEDNIVTDISPLSNLKELTYLNLKNNRINNIFQLSNLEKIQYLNLAENNLNDIEPLNLFAAKGALKWGGNLNISNNNLNIGANNVTSTIGSLGQAGTNITYLPQNDIQIKINDSFLNLDVSPIISDGYTLVPIRHIAEALGMNVDYKDGIIILNNDSTDIMLQINNYTAKINGKEVPLIVAPQILNGRTLVPLRFVAESLGEEVEWESELRLITIGIGTIDNLVQKPADNLVANPQYINEEKLLEDTKLYIASDRQAIFKQNNPIKFHQNGFLQEGTLKENTTLNVDAKNSVSFKAGTQASFDANGFVNKGTLAAKSPLNFQESLSTYFAVNTVVEFYDNGNVKKGVLSNDSLLPYAMTRLAQLDLPNSDGQHASFKKNTAIEFSSKGTVEKGTLLAETTLLCHGQYTRFKGNEQVEFYDNGDLKAGVMLLDSYMEYQKGQYTYFKSGNEMRFYPNGRVASGVLVNDTRLEYNPKELTFFKSDTRVEFNSEGYVQSGTLRDYASLYYAPQKFAGFRVDSKVVFDNNGYVIEGVLNSDQHISLAVFKDATPITWHSNHQIKSGILRDDTAFSLNNNKTITLKAATLVEFSSAGSVMKGTLKEGLESQDAGGKVHRLLEGETIMLDTNGNIIK